LSARQTSDVSPGEPARGGNKI